MRARIVAIILACLFIIAVIAEAITIEAEGFISSHDEGGRPYMWLLVQEQVEVML